MAGLPAIPTERCYHYDEFSELPADIKKYWHQRYEIFSKYDEGIWMTDSAWYGVTPEPVAEAIATHVAEAAPAAKTVLIDAFAGVGGNTIAFARSGRWEQIFAIEKDPEVLKCAKHNARLYGVEKQIWWIEGDCFQILKKRLATMGKKAVVFGSPPWGGPGYCTDAIFDLATMQPYGLSALHEPFAKIARDVVLYLPRTSDLNQLAGLASVNKGLPVTHYCVKGASKALCVYFGDFKFD